MKHHLLDVRNQLLMYLFGPRRPPSLPVRRRVRPSARPGRQPRFRRVSSGQRFGSGAPTPRSLRFPADRSTVLGRVAQCARYLSLPPSAAVARSATVPPAPAGDPRAVRAGWIADPAVRRARAGGGAASGRASRPPPTDPRPRGDITSSARGVRDSRRCHVRRSAGVGIHHSRGVQRATARRGCVEDRRELVSAPVVVLRPTGTWSVPGG